jgi:hypothetical protein
VVGDARVPDGELDGDHLASRQHRLELVNRVMLQLGADNLQLRGAVDIAQLHGDGEAVELALGQRVGAVLLQRVLGRYHEQRLGQIVADPIYGDRVLLHRFEQGRLSTRSGPVHLVEQDHVGEDGAGDELEGEGSLIEDRAPCDIRRKQIGGRLDPLERARQRAGQGAAQHRLAHSRHILHQEVASGEQGRGGRLYGGPLASDYLLDIGYQEPGAAGSRGAIHRRVIDPL